MTKADILNKAEEYGILKPMIEMGIVPLSVVKQIRYYEKVNELVESGDGITCAVKKIARQSNTAERIIWRAIKGFY